MCEPFKGPNVTPCLASHRLNSLLFTAASINNFVYERGIILASGSQLYVEAGADGAAGGQGGGGGLGHFDAAVEEVFAGGEEFQARAEGVGAVGIQLEKAMEQGIVGVIVVLVAAHAALQAEGADAWGEGAQVEGAHVARDCGNPVAEIGGASGDGGVGVLVAAVHCHPAPRGQRKIKRNAFALDLAEVSAHQKDGGGIGIDGDGGDGAIDLGEEIAPADGAPVPLRGQAGFPAGGALALEQTVGPGELIADL